MTEEERVRMATIVLIERYMNILSTADVNAIRSEEGVGINHAYWMLVTMRPFLLNCDPTFDLYKAQRWLGFIQREMVLEGFVTVTGERNYSRALFKGTNAGVHPVNLEKAI